MSAIHPATPPTPNTSSDRILAAMRQQETGPDGVRTRLLMLGAVVVILTSVGIGIGIALLLYLWLDTSGIGAVGWIIVLLLVQGVYGYLLHQRTARELFADSALFYPESESGKLYAVFPAVLAPVERLLVGPQWVVGGLQRWRKPVAAEWDAFLTRCATMVRALASAGEAVPAMQLLQPGLLPKPFDRVLDHLDRRDWIGFSSDRSRVWLSGKAKDDLVKLGVPVGLVR